MLVRRWGFEQMPGSAPFYHNTVFTIYAKDEDHMERLVALAHRLVRVHSPKTGKTNSFINTHTPLRMYCTELSPVEIDNWP